ncbi:hypothetical protein ABPG75_013663 [Micractinium tetrahymenae]
MGGPQPPEFAAAFSDDEEPAGSGEPAGQPKAWAAPPRTPPTPSAQQQPHPQRPQGPGQGPVAPGVQAAGPPSLLATCLGVLGEHLPDLLEDEECLQEVLPALPSEAKACLLAVARLRRLLCDAALAALADEGHTVLDLHGCGEALSEGGLCAALRRMPHLRCADLGSCHVSGATLRTLGECCPALEVLRLGSPATDGSASAARALTDILPVPQQRQEAPAADSWDALLAVEDPGQLSAAVGGPGRLMQLQCLCWPNIPFRAEQHCRRACPRVALNPTAEEVAARRLPPACDPRLRLDAALLAGVARSERWQQGAPQEQRPAVVHIAEKFRQAYISRERRLRERVERQWRQERRREERRRSAAEALIRQWEGEL